MKILKDYQKINVLHIISSLEFGGAEKLLIDLMKSAKLESDNISFSVVVVNDKVNSDLKNDILSSGCEINFLSRPQGHKHYKYFLQLMNIIKQKNIHIIHSHDYGSKYWAMLCKIFNPKIKLVYTLHSLGIFDCYSKLKLFLHCTFIDNNIAISDTVMNDAKKYGIANIVRIYNGIVLDKYFQSNNRKNNCFKIVNVSRITHKIKGQDLLIKALNICKEKGVNFTCEFIGGSYDYDTKSFEYLKDLVAELKLEDCVSFLGNRTDIPELLSESDLFVLPSRDEGLGLVILEAMASKVPVITSNIDGPAELITHEENGLLFESENYQDLADKIIYLYNNRKKMLELSNSAYKFVLNFDISIMLRNYSDLYLKMIDG